MPLGNITPLALALEVAKSSISRSPGMVGERVAIGDVANNTMQPRIEPSFWLVAVSARQACARIEGGGTSPATPHTPSRALHNIPLQWTV